MAIQTNQELENIRRSLPAATPGVPQQFAGTKSPMEMDTANKTLVPQGYDSQGNRIPVATPAPAVAPTPLTPTATRYTPPTSAEVAQSSAEELRKLNEEHEKQRQDTMNRLNAKYDTQSQELMAQQRAINYNRGQVGAESGLAAKNKVSKAVEDERTGAISQALQALDDVFYKRARDVKSDAFANAEWDANVAEKKQAYDKETKATINASLATLGKAGNSLDDIKKDTQLYQQMVDSGISDIEIMATLNEASAKPTSFQIIGNKVVGTYFDPATGSIKTVTQDLGFDVPNPDDVVITKLGDDMVVYDKNTKQIVETIKGTPTALEVAQTNKIWNEINAPKDAGEQLYAGLNATTAGAVKQKVSKFSTEPLVQNFATIQEGNNLAASIPNNTKNPADDQALIYSLAKALDPGSVVREGEYATAQKYSQSWINAYGKGITQAIAGTGFLSETARKNIKKTIETKYNSSLKSYTNLQSQYANNINNITGRKDGANFLIDYMTPVEGGQSQEASTQTIQAPDGQEIEIID